MKSTSVLETIDRWLARQIIKRPLPLIGDAGVISFTFDDAPASACRAGKALLEKYGCQGTWYIAGDLTGNMEQGISCHTVEDLQELAANGHEIASHTFSHRPCRGRTSEALREEFEHNANFLHSITGTRPTNFSFPLGSYGLRAKHCSSRFFHSARLTRPGIHYHEADLNALLAQPIYSDEISEKRIGELIMATSEGKGWLIFYTHDISPTPSQWGCTPELFESAIARSQEYGCKILPVEKAIEYWQGRKS